LSLKLEIKKIDETCKKGEPVTGTLVLYVKDTDHLAFMLRVSHRRIQLSRTDYNGPVGEEGIGINYEISTFGFDQGTVFKGSISVISDQGEARIPVTLSIVRDELSSSQGPVRNLFHFTNLAKENYEEASRLFYTDAMDRIFSDGDRDTYFKYRAFSGLTGSAYLTHAGVEEFLIETNKKSPVLLNFAESGVMERSLTEDKEISVTVRKSGWGFPGFSLEADADFIELEKSEYGSEDFEGNFAEIRFIIKADRLHEGHNFGSLKLASLHTNISIPVFVDIPSHDRGRREKLISKQNAILKLMNEFISFRIGDSTGAEWIEHSGKLIERLLILDRNDPESRLMQAQLLLAAKRYDEADIVLSAVERQLDENDLPLDLRAYYIYLCAMCSQNDRDLKKAVKQVWDIYDRDRSSWRVLWILIYLDETIKMSPERERGLIEEHISIGMRSPLMYLEAYSILSHDPSLIRRLSEFEINVLGFAIRHGLLKKELADAVSLLSQRMRGYDPRLLKIMGAYFAEFDDDEMLVSICSYLIRNEVTDKRCFKYFKEAVDRDLGITNLYDYYLYTMDHQSARLLPKSLLMYYGLQNDLPPNLRSYVYANMIVNESEASGYLAQSEDACISFATREILSGHMDENLAIILDHFRFFRGVGSDIADTASLDKAIITNGFIRMITVSDPTIKEIIVVEEAFSEERIIALKNGKAYVSIYDTDYDIFFVDDKGRRYGRQYVTYDDTKLLRIYDFLNTIEYPELDDPGLWVALSERGRNYITVDDRNSGYVRSMIDCDTLTENFKDGLLTSLMRYYYDNDMQPELNDLLAQTDVDSLNMQERNEYVRFCSMRSDDEALSVIGKYGSYGMDPKILMRLSTRFIEESGVADPVILEMCDASFRGNKYNEVILGYMSRYYESTLRELKEIWRACRDFDADVSLIEGRILEQMLETGAYIGEKDEIFFDYIRHDASKKIVSRYYRRAAEDAFLKDTLMDDRLYMGLLEYAIDEDITDIEALCLIRFYAGRRDLRADKILYPYVRDMAERDIVFEFFMDYRNLFPGLDLFAEEIFIEYRGTPGARVELNYVIDQDGVYDVDYCVERMKELFPGVYQTRCIVYPGELLQYYITENGGARSGPVRSGVEKSMEQLSNRSRRYDILQDALTSRRMGDTESFLELTEDYMIKEKVVREVIWEES
jgi:hypothetical protein